MDLVAAKLEAVVQPDDLILINTWNFGVSFHRYYHGAAPSTTIPPIADLRTHRVDLAKKQMMSHEPLAPVLRQIEDTLRAGHTVWLVGYLRFLEPGQTPLQVPPGFDGPAGWVGGDFLSAWSEQVGMLTRQHATPTAWSSRPPGLLRRSRIKRSMPCPLSFWSASSISLVVVLVKLEMRIKPTPG